MSGVELIAAMYAAFGRDDVPAVVGSMHPEIRWHEAEGNPYRPSGEPWIGPDAVVKNLFVKLAEEWDGFTVHPGTYHDAGDVVVVVEARYTGNCKANGRFMDTQVCHLRTIKDGKAAKFQQYVDTGKMQDVTGQRP